MRKKEEPVKNQEAVTEIIEYYAGQKNPSEQENLTAMLREIQETEGCISREVQEMAAQKMGIKPGVISCIIRLYPSLKEAPYAHEILICTGDRCGSKNSKRLLETVKKELRPDKNGLSADKRILLVTRNCLKQYRTSPNLMIDGKLYPAMTEEKLKSLIRELCC